MKSLTILTAALVAMLAGNFTADGQSAPRNAAFARTPALRNVTFTARQVETSFTISITNKLVTTTHDLVLKGKKIGRDQVECTITGPGTFAECSATALLHNGQIQEQGALDPVKQKKFTVTITGGSGIYTGVSGTVDVNRSTPVATNVYHIHGVS